ncbi:hypothetical protein Tco_0935366 [Tanacetum coccineum]
MEDYVAPATKSILDELLEEFRDKILNITMVDEGADFNPNKDIQELEKLLANDLKQHYMEIQVNSVIINPSLCSPIFKLLGFAGSHTTPPNEDYEAPATKSILDELLEEFRDKILELPMVDEGADFNPNKDYGAV